MCLGYVYNKFLSILPLLLSLALDLRIKTHFYGSNINRFPSEVSLDPARSGLSYLR